jgi:hypothetical protein
MAIFESIIWGDGAAKTNLTMGAPSSDKCVTNLRKRLCWRLFLRPPGCSRLCDKCVTKVLKSVVLLKGLLPLQRLKQQISKKYNRIEGQLVYDYVKFEVFMMSCWGYRKRLVILAQMCRRHSTVKSCRPVHFRSHENRCQQCWRWQPRSTRLLAQLPSVVIRYKLCDD